MQPKVSILIPAYNAERLLAETLRSAIGQTWKNKEIIVVDDGSRDHTLEIARRFSADGVTVVTQPNQGAAAARNRAFSLSRGDYIQWLDADDLLAPDKIFQQMELVKRGLAARTLISSAWGHFYYRAHKVTFVPTPLWADLSPVEWMIRKFESGAFMQTATWLVSRELANAAGPWNTRLLGDDDGEYFCRVILRSDAVRFVPDSKVLYRNPSSSSLSYIGRSSAKLDAHFLSMELHINHLLSLEDSARVRAACVSYLQWWLGVFYPGRPDIINKAEQMAVAFGGRLEVPSLSWKYAWLKGLFGWTFAKRVQLGYNHWKSSSCRRWDQALYRLEGLIS